MMANRVEATRIEEERRDKSRAELRVAADRLIRTTQLAEEAAAHHPGDELFKGKAATEMWIAYKSLRLIADVQVQQRAAELCDTLSDCLWRPNEDEPWQRVHEQNARFAETVASSFGCVAVRAAAPAETGATWVSMFLDPSAPSFGTSGRRGSRRLPSRRHGESCRPVRAGRW